MSRKRKTYVMPNYVMEMSDDRDIINTGLDASWNPVSARYSWNQVCGMNLNIPNEATIIVIAHGNDTEIGNRVPGTIDINATTFLANIQSNMAHNSLPAAIYISTCGNGIALFAAAVRIAAENNNIWDNTSIYGHSTAIAGDVPPAGNGSWTQIF